MILPANFLEACGKPNFRAVLLTALAEEEIHSAKTVEAIWPDGKPRLPKLLAMQIADEYRHAEMFMARADAQGCGRVSSHLPERMTIDNMISLANPRTETDLLMLVRALEEVTISEYPQIAAAIEPTDSVTADVLTDIVRDECKHVRYCNRIALEYCNRSHMEAVYSRMIGVRDRARL